MCSTDFYKSLSVFTLVYSPFMGIVFLFTWATQQIMENDKRSLAARVYDVWGLAFSSAIVMIILFFAIACLWRGRPLPSEGPVTTIYLNESLLNKAMVYGYWTGYTMLIVVGVISLTTTTCFLIYNTFLRFMPSEGAIALTVFIATYLFAVAGNYNAPTITYVDARV